MTMLRETRAFPRYAYCRRPGCRWTDTVPGDQLDGQAQAHADETGHEVRLVDTAETIIRPAPGKAAR